MKIRNIFSLALAASALLFASCTKETATDSFDNIKLDKTYLSIPAEGGSIKLSINATDSWKFVKDATWPEVISFAKDENGKTYKATTDQWGNITNPEEQIASRTASWLSSSVLEGAAGAVEVTFSAEAVAGGRELSLAIVCGDHLQHVVVRQGTLEASNATCAEVLAGPDGKTYRTKGTCTAIANTTYGNWYLNDGTGEVYIYGTLDAKGAERNFASLGLEVGDVVELEGPKTIYGSTVELVNVTVIKITKALAKVVTDPAEFQIPGTYSEETKKHEPFIVKVAYKGGNFGYSVPETQDWVSVVSVTNVKGVPSKLEQNPADTAYVGIKVLPNAGGDRSGSIDFTSGSSKVTYTFTQKGAVIAATVEEFLAAAMDDTQYRVTGVITKISSSAQYHNANITVSSGNFASSILLYRTVTAEGNIEDLGLAVGDVVTVVGKRSEYNGTPQMAQGGVLESYQRYATKTIAEFLAAPVDASAFYTVSGEITIVAGLSGKDSYNNVNITIKDGNDELYLYRVTTFDGTDVAVLNPQVGAKITVFGTRAEYKGTPQMAQGGKVIAYTPAE